MQMCRAAGEIRVYSSSPKKSNDHSSNSIWQLDSEVVLPSSDEYMY